jgi:hypothetical protein
MNGGAAVDAIFLICAAVGGTLLVCQFLLGLVGLGHHDFGQDHAMEHGHDHGTHEDHESWYVGLLTLRALVAALTFFGLGGLIASHQTEEPALSLGFAGLSGLASLFLVGWIMKMLMHLKAEGTLRIDRAVGMTGTVYLSVPGKSSGAGKVTVKVQNRTVEYQAVSRNEALATGTPIQVVAVVGPDTVEVAPVPQA